MGPFTVLKFNSASLNCCCCCRGGGGGALTRATSLNEERRLLRLPGRYEGGSFPVINLHSVGCNHTGRLQGPS